MKKMKKATEFIVAMMAIAVVSSGCGNKDALVEVPEDIQAPASVTVGNDGVSAGIATEIPEASNNMTSITVESTGRENPFAPDASITADGYYVSTEMMAPHNDITTNPDAEKLVTTKVTGILHDSTSPSAIINISGSDYLVRIGDLIQNCKVLSIGQKSVTIKLGNNIYKAGVGELFSKEGMNYNTISNLESKFGGNRR